MNEPFKAKMTDDLISRQDAIDAMATWDWQEVYLPIHFKQLLEELPSAQPEQQWIPVSERLPKEPFGCIVSYHGFMLTPYGEREYDAIYPELLGYDGTDWNNSEGECVDNMIDVTAWMPLPEPYKEGKE